MKEFVYDLIAIDGAVFDSTAIDVLAFNRETSELFINFQSGGDYVYADVSESTYNMFVESDSLGRFYQKNISGKYTRVDDTIDSVVEREPEEDFSDFPAAKTGPSMVNSGITMSAGVPGAAGSTSTLVYTFPNVAVVANYEEYGVKYSINDTMIVAEAAFSAMSEKDALEQFSHNIKLLGVPVTIKSVTHYF